MKRLSLSLLALVFGFTLNLTLAQDATNSNDVKKPEVTKPTDVQKSTDVTKSNVTGKQTVHTKPDGIKTDVVTKGTGKPVNAMCIVSGEDIDSKITADYKTKTYAFCCKKCLAKFTKDPEKYVAKFEKQKAKSKTL